MMKMFKKKCQKQKQRQQSDDYGTKTREGGTKHNGGTSESPGDIMLTLPHFDMEQLLHDGLSDAHTVLPNRPDGIPSSSQNIHQRVLTRLLHSTFVRCNFSPCQCT
eukprot:4875467-Ditylum_brightwellii.AAC.1